MFPVCFPISNHINLHSSGDASELELQIERVRYLRTSEEEWKLVPALTPTQLKYYMTNFRKHTGKIGYQVTN